MSRVSKTITESLKLAAGLAVHPVLGARWIQFSLQEKIAPQDDTTLRIRAFNRVFKPFADKRWPAAERYRQLVHHYEFLNTLRAQKGIDLSKDWLVACGQPDITFLVSPMSIFSKEGALKMTMRFQKQDLYSVIFSFANLGGETQCLLSCVQGHQADPALIKACTMAAQRMLPKRLMVYALRNFCAQLGIHSLAGIHNDNHIYHSARYALTGHQERIKFDYDEFFATFYGSKDNQVWRLQPPNYNDLLDEIPANKRSNYRKRQTLIDSIVIDPAA